MDDLRRALPEAQPQSRNGVVVCAVLCIPEGARGWVCAAEMGSGGGVNVYFAAGVSELELGAGDWEIELPCGFEVLVSFGDNGMNSCKEKNIRMNLKDLLLGYTIRRE